MTGTDDGVRDANQIFAETLLGALAAAGVEHVCLCPGSRSTPIAVAAARTDGLVLHPHLDERACGYFALGIARASRRPVALVCTSGTAAANFLPAVVEAFYARVPLIVLTANRPPELRGWGAGQTIDQARLFGTHALLFVEAPVPGPGLALVHYARALAARAVATALGRPAGPVHLDLPFREPLEPGRGERRTERGPLPPAPDLAEIGRVSGAAPVLPDAEVTRLAAQIEAEPRGVIVAGPTDRDGALGGAAGRLASRLGWPLLAEPISQLRSGVHTPGAPLIAHYDAFLRDLRFARDHTPGIVLQLGDTPTSKPLRQWLEADASTRFVRVDPDGAWHDPSHRSDAVLRADAALVCDALREALPIEGAGSAKGWLDDFIGADHACARTFDEALVAEPRLLPPAIVRLVAQVATDGACVFVSNSMAVRDVDTFWPVGERRVRFLCNRGANGIDGIVSTALGASLVTDGPTVLLAGDLAFLHDVGGLFAARRLEASCTILVLNDDGGGIFSFLPIAEHGDAVRFDELFTLAHGLSLAPAAALYGVEHRRAADEGELRRALAASIGLPGVRVIEVPIDRAANVAHHRALWRAVSAALGGGAGRA